MRTKNIALASLTHEEPKLDSSLYGLYFEERRDLSPYLRDHLVAYDLSKNRNRHFFMRHGNAENNTCEMCFAHPEAAKWSCALTPAGKEEVASSISLLKENHILDETTLIFCSPFLRTRQSAEIAREILCSPSIILSNALRERYFGEFDLGPTCGVGKSVYELDIVDPSHTHYGVESVMKVLDRITGEIVMIDQAFVDTTILWISHLYPLQLIKRRDSLHDYFCGDKVKNAEVFNL